MQLLKVFVVNINLKNKNMKSGLYKKYIGSPCKKNGIDPKLIVDSVKKAAFDKDFNELQTVNKTKDVKLTNGKIYSCR